MSGIYLHIPFCKQACHYCDFHFSTNLKHKAALLEAMQTELRSRQGEKWEKPVETLYFGGGTPSLLTPEEIAAFVELVAEVYGLSDTVEITLEANPDDLDTERLRQLKAGPVNRLSIGIQSFQEPVLRWMNRAHSAREAIECLEEAAGLFDNFSIDLIYGIPGELGARWEADLDKALEFMPAHISAYALTVEPRTALHAFIARGQSPEMDESRAESDFQLLVRKLGAAGYEHYEISNFALPGYQSRNNSAYWQGKPYIGIGPSAHSYDGSRRRWNLAHNLKYAKAIAEGKDYFEEEVLSPRDRYNEAVMTGLRTIWGVSLAQIKDTLGPKYREYLLEQAAPYLDRDLLTRDGEALRTTPRGKFLVDGIASDLFMVNLR